MNPRIFLAVVIFAAEMFAGAMAQAGCKQLFVHHAPVQAVVVPQVYYFAGGATQDEALIRKAIRAELPAIIQQLRQGEQGRTEGEQRGEQTQSLLNLKCARCHSGESAKGGVDLTGVLDDSTRWRITEILSNHDVPKAMQAVIGGLKQGEHATILEELMRSKPAKPEPQVLPPDPEPGVLR